MKNPCRHRNAWVITSYFRWCPDCGGIRKFYQDSRKGAVPAWSKWIRPGNVEKACSDFRKEGGGADPSLGVDIDKIWRG